MARIRLVFVLIGTLLFSLANAVEAFTSKDLAGSWKITDVKITNNGSAKPVTKDNCYLCDLYKANLGLVFTADGKVNYSNYANANPVEYTVNGNILSMFAEGSRDAQKPEHFIVSISGNILTLTRVYPEFTETYTLSK